MKQYIASLITMSRLVIGTILFFRYKSKHFTKDDAPILLISIAWCILSDKLDGIVARAWGSVEFGDYIDFFSDRLCMSYLLYLTIDNKKMFLVSIIPQILMCLWKISCVWPTNEQAISLNSFSHIGRISIVIESLACLFIISTKFYPNQYLKKFSIVALYFGIALTSFAVIYYPLTYKQWYNY